MASEVRLKRAKFETPAIIEGPQDQMIQEERTVTLYCKVTGNPTPTVIWYKNNQELKDTATRFMDNNNLFFLSVSKMNKDEGRYYCKASNAMGSVRSKTAYLSIYFLEIEFQELSPPFIEAEIQSFVELKCSPPKGNPRPEVTWYKNGRSFTHSRATVFNNGSLIFHHVSLKDSGSYVCNASSLYNYFRTSRPMKLSVIEPPSISISNKVLHVKVGDDPKLKCNVKGIPQPSVKWSRRKFLYGSNKQWHFEDNRTTLVLYDVGKGDSDNYTCSAANKFGVANNTIQLIVEVRKFFVEEPRDKIAAINSTARLDCLVDGTLYWKSKNIQQPLFQNDMIDRFQVTPNGSLLIHSVQDDDRGYYQCVVVTKESIHTANAYLDVRDVLDKPPPLILLGPYDQTVPYGEKVRIPCKVDSDGGPTVRWMKDKHTMAIEENRIALEEDGTLTIKSALLEDSGNYTCIAVSSRGEVRKSAFLFVKLQYPIKKLHEEPPLAPRLLRVDRVYHQSIDLSWKPPNDEHSLLYRLEYFAFDYMTWNWEFIDIVVPDSTSYTLRGLRPGTAYVFSLRARNRMTFGYATPVTAQFKTIDKDQHIMSLPNASKYLMYTNVKLLRPFLLSSTSVSLSWQVEHYPYIIQRFMIQICVSSSDDCKNIPIEDHHVRSYTLSKLSPFTTYNLIITPFSEIKGKDSAIAKFTSLPDVPDAPPQKIRVFTNSSAGILVTWQPPPLKSWNGQPQGYAIVCTLANGNTLLNATINNPNTVSKFIKHFPMSKERIYVSMAARSSVGEGIMSDPVYADINGTSTALSILKDPIFLGIAGAIIWLILLLLSLIIYRRHQRMRQRYHDLCKENHPMFNSSSGGTQAGINPSNSGVWSSSLTIDVAKQPIKDDVSLKKLPLSKVSSLSEEPKKKNEQGGYPRQHPISYLTYTPNAVIFPGPTPSSPCQLYETASNHTYHLYSPRSGSPFEYEQLGYSLSRQPLTKHQISPEQEIPWRSRPNKLRVSFDNGRGSEQYDSLDSLKEHSEHTSPPPGSLNSSHLGSLDESVPNDHPRLPRRPRMGVTITNSTSTNNFMPHGEPDSHL